MDKLGTLHTGTTTVGVICADGVVLATDTRVTMGFFVAHRYGKKVFKIGDHMAMTIAGTAAHGQSVVEILRANASLYALQHGRPMPVAAAARLAANILFGQRFSPLALQAIIGGMDESGPHLYALDPFGSVTEEKLFSTGSGSPIALGVLETEFKDRLPVEEVLSLTVKAVTSAMKRDIGSGDGFDVVVVTKEGYRELSKEEKEAVLAKAS